MWSNSQKGEIMVAMDWRLRNEANNPLLIYSINIQKGIYKAISGSTTGFVVVEVFWRDLGIASKTWKAFWW